MTEPNKTPPQPAHGQLSALRYDPEHFRSDVEDMGLSRDQQDALLEDVWLIVVGVLDSASAANRFPPSLEGKKTLAADSGSVLRSIINSKEQRARDAQAEKGLNAARKDS